MNVKLNVYDFEIKALCPADGESIVYRAQIATDKMIMVESINAFASKIEEGFHENIADLMLDAFGGSQQLRAVHQGVHITTLRADATGIAALAPADTMVEPLGDSVH